MTSEHGDPIVEFSADDALAALSRDEFFLVYQPEFDLQTNAFVGVEALLRWRHPSRGVVLPSAFLAPLEASGEITIVGRWTLQSACAQGAQWHDMGYRFSVSINVSPRQVRDESFFDDVLSALQANRFSPSQLVLEVSLQSLTDTSLVTDQMRQLQHLGVRIAVDDVDEVDLLVDRLGSMPVDIVKLDRQFVAGMSGDSAPRTLRQLVDMARVLKLQVIASGIEDASQRQLLQFGQVGVGQGYHFSVPREASEIDQLLLDFSLFSGKPLYTE